MLRALTMFAAIAAAPSDAEADDQKALTELMSAVFSNMATTWVCKDALKGLSFYQAARSTAIGALSPYVGEKQAVLYVDEMDRKFRDDPRGNQPDADSLKCLQMVNDGMYRIQVARANMR